MPWLVAFLIIVAAYLVGAIPFGYLVARWRGINIFEHGSKNIGATNVGRVLGQRFGILVFVLDFAKGAGPVTLAVVLKGHFEEALWTRGFVEVGAGLFAFVGHMFPIYLRFRGGKGVATGAGAVAGLMPIPHMFVAVFVWLVVVCASRYVSLASICAVVTLCIVLLRQPEAWDWRNPRTWFLLGGGALVILKHHGNIRRLLNGTESQLQETFLMHQLSKSLHVLALGLWFGASVFFTFVVALSLFNTFETLGQKKERASWLPQPAMYADAKDFDAPKEQGTRAAGYAVGPMFQWYFALQGVCGFIALATALPWLKFAPESRMHRWRVSFLIVALACVVVGWPIEQKVTGLRDPRNQATEAYLLDRASETKLSAMKAARAEFGQWHMVSLALNLATIILVTGGMALAGNLPSRSATAASEALPKS